MDSRDVHRPANEIATQLKKNRSVDRIHGDPSTSLFRNNLFQGVAEGGNRRREGFCLVVVAG